MESRGSHRLNTMARLLRGLHLDGMLFAGIIAILAAGMLALYSATGQSTGMLVNQSIRVLAALAAMLLLAQVEPTFMRRVAPWIYLVGLALLATVLVAGETTAISAKSLS